MDHDGLGGRGNHPSLERPAGSTVGPARIRPVAVCDCRGAPGRASDPGPTVPAERSLRRFCRGGGLVCGCGLLRRARARRVAGYREDAFRRIGRRCQHLCACRTVTRSLGPVRPDGNTGYRARAGTATRAFRSVVGLCPRADPSRREAQGGGIAVAGAGAIRPGGRNGFPIWPVVSRAVLPHPVVSVAGTGFVGGVVSLSAQGGGGRGGEGELRKAIYASGTAAALFLVLNWALANSLPEAWRNWRYSRAIELDPTNQPRLVSFAVTPEVYPHAQTELQDLRLIADHGNEAPYLLHARTGSNRSEQRGTRS